jgi:hypothetical protein
MSTTSAMASRIERLPGGVRARIADWKVLHLPGNVPPWTASGIDVSAGDEVTWLADGKVVASEELDLRGGPSFHLWARVGTQGPIFKGTQSTFSFRAERSGPLEFATYQGEWGTRDGQLATPVEAYQTVGGAIDVIVIRWNGAAADGLPLLRAALPDDALVAAEAIRQAAPLPKPPGWEPLWFLGDNEIFTPRRHGASQGISVHTCQDVGILQRRVDCALRPDTRVGWRWLVSKLPGGSAENTIPTHDYLSIAFEFENGLDLTYFWSAELPVGTVFTCPLPTWAPRETHQVVRSGPAGLGAWQNESRNLFEDYRAALGEPPQRVVGVWLIAVSIFRRGEGIAEFADITIESPEAKLRVL